MAEHHDNSTKLLSISSWDDRDSSDSSNTESFQGDEGFYEAIEAPKFVDFTAPDHYCPDDRYWFCDRVGCDQKHEEEMDSEAIYNKFVLRAMAARSPNVVRLRKIDASRKCPLSAPPKASKPRMTFISSFPKKVDEKVKAARPLLKPRSTKPVSAKYLSTPRIKKGTQDENSFRSVRNTNSDSTEAIQTRMVAKALTFHSPNKRVVKVKTSVELRTPVSKLCEGINKLEISSQRKGYTGKSSMTLGSGRKVLRKPEETRCSKTSSILGKSIRSKIKGGKSSQLQSLKSKGSCEMKQRSTFELRKSTPEEATTRCSDSALSDDSKGEGSYFDLCLKTSSNQESKQLSLKNEESREIREQLSAQKVSEEFELKKATHEEATRYSDSALSDDSIREGNYFELCLKTSSNQESKSSVKSEIKGKSPKHQSSKNEESREMLAQKVAEEFEMQNSTQEETKHDSDSALSDDSKGEESHDLQPQATNMQENSISDSKETAEQLIENNTIGRERDVQHAYKPVDDDNKENAAASDENRMHEINPNQNEKKILGVQNGKKVVTRAQDKKLKDSLISSSSVVKLQKPKATNPKPFRLRTDERGILKERRTEPVVPQSESVTSNALKGKSQMKQMNDFQGIKIPKGQERSKPVAAVTPENTRKHMVGKSINSPRESKAMQRLEKFRKISSPLQKPSVKPQGLVSTKNQLTSFLVPGQKLDAILENSPEVLALKRAGKRDDPLGDDAAASQPSSRVRLPVAKPTFHSTHVRRTTSCTKKLK